MNNSDKVYRSTLEKEAQAIQNKIQWYNKHNHGVLKNVGIPDKKIGELTARYNLIIEELHNFEHDGRERLGSIGEIILNKTDEKVNKNNVKINKTKQEIERLKSLRNSLNSNYVDGKIRTKIGIKKEIKELYKNNNKIISLGQNAIILPKTTRNKYRRKLLAKQQSKIDSINDSIAYNNHLQSMLNPNSSKFDSFMDSVYDLKSIFYHSRLSYTMDVLNYINSTNSTIKMRGAGVIVLGKGLVNKFKQRINANANSRGANTR